MKTILCLSLLVPLIASARLGETMEECDARYGQARCERPPRFPGSKTRKVYVADVFRLDIEFNADGRAWVLLFRHASPHHLKSLGDKRAEIEYNYHRHTYEWQDLEPFDKLDWTASNYKDTEAVERQANTKKAARDEYAFRGAANIHQMPVFFQFFFPGVPRTEVHEERVVGMAGLVYDILQSNAGKAEWRNNGDFKPLREPPERTSTFPLVVFDDKPTGFHAYGLSSNVRSLHRSDRQAFACQSDLGTYLWTREADHALIAYSARRLGEVEEWSKKRGSKF
jgi:hypothetical protein